MRVLKTKVRITTGDPYTLAAPAERRKNYGHWVDVPRSTWNVQPSGNDYDTTVNQIPAGVVVPGLTGVMMRWYWRELETALGTYPFLSGSTLNPNHRLYKELAFCRAHDLQYIILVEDKVFNGKPTPLPAYMTAPVNYAHTNSGVGGGWTSYRWSAYVLGRKRALAQALAVLDLDNNFEGLAYQETALGLGDPPPDAPDTPWSNAAFRDALVTEGRDIASAFTKGRYLCYQNYFPNKTGDTFLDAAMQTLAADANTATCMGGPDTLPLAGSLLQRVYPRYTDPLIANKITTFCSCQQNSYHHSTIDGSNNNSTGPWFTPEQIFFWAVDNLGVKDFVWTYIKTPDYAHGYSYADAAVVIAAHPHPPYDTTPRVKWTPSHGVKCGTDRNINTSEEATLTGFSKFKFFDVNLNWGRLEPNAGTYNYAYLDQALASADTDGVGVMCAIITKLFATGGDFPGNVMPADLIAAGKYSYIPSVQNGVIMVNLWDSAVMDRLIAFWQETARRYDGVPGLQGMYVTECSPSLGGTSPNGYTDTKYVTQLKRLYAAIGAAFVRTNVFAHLNSLGGHISELLEAAYQAGCGLSTPDATSTTATELFTGASYGGETAVRDYRGKIPFYAIASAPVLGGKDDNGPPSNVINWCQARSVTHLSWINYAASPNAVADIKAAINADPNLYTSCPLQYGGLCAT